MDFYLKKPKLIVLLGYPLEHTLSPLIHNNAFKYLGLDFVYTAFPIEPNNFSKLDLKAFPIYGGNITIPFKEKIFTQVDHFSDEVKKIGAINTFYKKDNLLYAENTDYFGFIKALTGLEQNFNNKTVLLLGTGGSAKAVSTALNYLKVKKVLVVSRDLETSTIFCKNRAEILENIIFEPFNYATLELYSQVHNIATVINSTPVGMYDNNSPLSESFIKKLNKETLIYDLIYNPPKTKLLELAEENNLKILNGKSMLINQAGKAFELWTGKEFPYDYINSLKF